MCLARLHPNHWGLKLRRAKHKQKNRVSQEELEEWEKPASLNFGKYAILTFYPM